MRTFLPALPAWNLQGARFEVFLPRSGISEEEGESDAVRRVTVTLRIDTPIEVDYYAHGGILPYVLRQLLAA